MPNETQDSTMFKTFSNWTELVAKTVDHKIYIRLSNGWFINVTKKSLKETADSIKKNGRGFSGKITMMGGGRKSVQITLH